MEQMHQLATNLANLASAEGFTTAWWRLYHDFLLKVGEKRKYKRLMTNPTQNQTFLSSLTYAPFLPLLPNLCQHRLPSCQCITLAHDFHSVTTSNSSDPISTLNHPPPTSYASPSQSKSEGRLHKEAYARYPGVTFLTRQEGGETRQLLPTTLSLN